MRPCHKRILLHPFHLADHCVGVFHKLLGFGAEVGLVFQGHLEVVDLAGEGRARLTSLDKRLDLDTGVAEKGVVEHLMRVACER